ncbi:MAG: PEP-CTERM sorting domain-containing protein [Bryobacteraceae bacterium]
MATLLIVASAAAKAAQFQFGVLVQAGIAGAGDWEIGVGTTSAAPVNTASLANQWVNGADRAVQMEYLKGTNTVNVRVYNGATTTGAFTQASYNPTGGGLVGANAIWTLPTASFFATATSGTLFGTSITVSNLTLSGVSGAINIIQPIQQTTLDASRGFLGATDTVSQSQNIVFTADSSGSWRLTGTINMTGLPPTLLGATGNQLALSVGASAVDAVPEPGTFGFMLLGAGLIFGARFQKARAGY